MGLAVGRTKKSLQNAALHVSGDILTVLLISF